MKRLLVVWLVLCLIGTAALAEGQGALSSLPSVKGFAALNGELYALSYDGVYRVTGEGWQRCVSDGSIRAIAAGERELYLLTGTYGDEPFLIASAAQREDGSLGEPESVCEVGWGLRAGDWPEQHGFAVAGEYACVLVFDDAASDGQWFNNSLYRVSLADGSADKLAQGLMTCLTVAPDGQVLTLDNGRQQLVAIDAAAGTLTDLAALPGSDCGGLAYDAAQEVVCFRRGNELYGLSAAQPEIRQYGYLPQARTIPEMMLAAARDGCYYVTDEGESGYLSCPIDPAQVPSRTLRVAGAECVSEPIRAFLQEHHDVAVSEQGGLSLDAEAFLRHMQSDVAADIYALDIDCGYFAALRDKGYLADLSGSEEIAAFVGRMYPQLTKELFKDGGLYALPVSMYAFTQGYHPAALRRAGLTEANLPASYDELMDFIARWEAEFYDEHPDMLLYLTASDMFENLFDELLDAQLLLCEARGETPTFNTPDMWRLLNRLEALHPVIDEVVPIPEADGHGVVYAYGDPERQLFLGVDSPLPSELVDRNTKPLALSLTAEQAPVIKAHMTVLVVNPYSDQQELAMELMAYVTECLPKNFMLAVMPDESEPLENSWYAEYTADTREAIAEVMAQMETCDPAERAELESLLQELRAQQEALEHDRWAFSEEDIAWYREHIAPYLTVTTTSLLSRDDAETQSLRRRYLDGQMELEQFIREFDRVMTMRIKENQ